MTENAVEQSKTRAYQDKLRALLGSRDPLAVLEETPDAIARLIAGHSADLLRRRPYPDRWTWTINEILGHLVDTEWVYGYRVRLIASEDRPTILGMDQDGWVAAQRYDARDPGANLADFRALRSVNLRLWRSLVPGALARVGVHNERGEESLGLMLTMHAGHDLSHLEQIRKYLAAVGSGR